MRMFVCAFLLIASCHGGMHKAGERMWSVEGFASNPVVGNVLWWDGKGDVENGGVGIANRWFVQDRWALGTAVRPTLFREDGAKTWGVEVDFNLRWYLWETERIALFLDGSGGFLWTENPVPATATDYNFTFGVGPGFEIPLGESFSFLGGVELHHISNGRGLNVPSNPAQNEVRVWLGFGRTW